MIACIVGKKTPAFFKTYNQVLSSFGENRSVEKRELGKENIQKFFDELQTPSLFGDKKIFVIENLFADEDVKKEVLEKMKSLDQMSHDAIIVLESILAPDVKKIEKFIEIHKVAEKEIKEKKMNPFALADAFGSGDRKQSWITFQKVSAESPEMEMTHGMVWWKLKDMMTKRSIFSQEQLNSMARKLVEIYHDARLGGRGIGERLEEFFLTLPNNKK